MAVASQSQKVAITKLVASPVFAETSPEIYLELSSLVLNVIFGNERDYESIQIHADFLSTCRDLFQAIIRYFSHTEVNNQNNKAGTEKDFFFLKRQTPNSLFEGNK